MRVSQHRATTVSSPNSVNLANLKVGLGKTFTHAQGSLGQYHHESVISRLLFVCHPEATTLRVSASLSPVHHLIARALGRSECQSINHHLVEFFRIVKYFADNTQYNYKDQEHRKSRDIAASLLGEIHRYLEWASSAIIRWNSTVSLPLKPIGGLHDLFSAGHFELQALPPSVRNLGSPKMGRARPLYQAF